MAKDTVKFSRLSWPVKVGVVGGWICAIIYMSMFLAGFIIGLIEAV